MKPLKLIKMAFIFMWLLRLFFLTFLFLFPSFPLQAGEPAGWRDFGIHGGQIFTIAVDPENPNIIYAGSYYGDGLFKSTNRGMSWQSVAGFRNETVWAISFDPHNHLKIWVVGFWGIYISEDGGLTWKYRDPALTLGSFRYYYSLAVDPVNPDTVYVGTSGLSGYNNSARIYKTTDGGETWQEMSLIADHNVWNLAINPQNPQEIWAVTGPEWVSEGSIYQSQDGGSTWNQINTGLPASWFWVVLINPQNPHIVFVGGEKGLYRTQDGGQTWSQLEPNNWCRGLMFTSQNPNTIYASWYDQGGVISKSTDGGETWEKYSISPYEFLYLSHDPQYPNVLYAADGHLGILRSIDQGKHWNFINQGVRANHIFASALSPSGKLLVGSLAGVFLKTIGGNWNRIDNSPAFAVAFSPGNENIIYAGFDWGLGKSTDSGQTWSTFVQIPSDESNKVTSIAINPLTPQILYLGVYYRSGVKGEIYKSTDAGESISLVKTLDVPVNVVRVNPQNPQTIYAGSGLFYAPGLPGGIYKSTDGGATWDKMGWGVVVNALALDPENPEVIYAGCGTSAGYYAGLYKSTDGGETWEGKNFGILSGTGIADIEIDPDNNNILYAVTHRKGIYISYDGGNYWTRLGLSEYWLYDILIKPSGHSGSKQKIMLTKATLPSSTLYAGSQSGMLEYTGSGIGTISGTVTDAKTSGAITEATISTDTGGIALTLSGNYIMVVPAGQCMVTGSKDGYQPSALSRVTVTSGVETQVNLSLEPVGNLYFPHIASGNGWETEIALINSSSSQTLTGDLKAYSNEGQQVSSTFPITLAPHGRRQITIGNEFSNPGTIGYLIFESNAENARGYTKFYQQGIYRVAIPATREINSNDIYLSHIASNQEWWTGISLFNNNLSPVDLTIEFNDGTSKAVSLEAKEHSAFTIQSLFNEASPSNIQSAVIKNGSGVIGLELFGSIENTGRSCLSGIPLSDETAFTIYYPHVASDDTWWTGIVAYNPSPTPCSLTITPYSAGGTPLATQSLSLNSKGKYMGTVSNLNLPSGTAWFQIDGTSGITGFELFGTNDWNQLAGFSSLGISGKERIFAKLEKDGWTGIAFVNTESSRTSVTLTAYDDHGNSIATTSLNLNGYEKKSDLAENLFTQDISNATYIGYSSDQEVVGFQLNGSFDGTMLDGLPGM